MKKGASAPFFTCYNIYMILGKIVINGGKVLLDKTVLNHIENHVTI